MNIEQLNIEQLKERVTDIRKDMRKKEKQELSKKIEDFIQSIIAHLEKEAKNLEKTEYNFSDEIISSKIICYNNEKLKKIKKILKKKLKKIGLRVNIEKKKKLICEDIIAGRIYNRWWEWKVSL